MKIKSAIILLTILRQLRDAHPHIWDNIIVDHPEILDIWDELKAIIKNNLDSFVK